MRRLCFCAAAISLLTVQRLYAQQERDIQMNSLLAALPHTKDDTGKAGLLLKIALALPPGEVKRCMTYASEALALAEGAGWKTGQADAHYRLAACYKQTTDYQLAMAHASRAKELDEATGRRGNVSVDLRTMAMIYYDQHDNSKALEYLSLSLKAAQASGNQAGAAATLNNFGLCYTRMADYPTAATYYQRAQSINEALDNQVEVARNLGNLAATYRLQGDFSKALDVLLKTLKINESRQYRPGVAFNLYEIGCLFQKPGEELKAREYLSRALAVCNEVGDRHLTALTLNALGNTYFDEGAYARLFGYEQAALRIYESTNDSNGMANTTGFMAAAYGAQKKYGQALLFYDRAIQLLEKTGNKHALAYSVSNRGQLYQSIAKDSGYAYHSDSLVPGTRQLVLQKSLSDYQQAIAFARAAGGLDLLQGILKELSEVQALSGDYLHALQSFQEHIRYKDSIYSREKSAAITQQLLRYEYGKREDSLRFQKQLADRQLAEQTQQNKQQQQALTLKQQQLVIINKEADLRQLAFLKTQAELQLEQSRYKEKEKALTIAGKENSLKAAALQLQHAQLALQDQELETRMLQRNSIIAGLAAFLLFGGFAFSRYQKQKRLEKSRAVLAERLRISRDLHDDMGATLSSISVYSTAVKQRMTDGRFAEAQAMLDTISTDARDMVSNMSDMIWMINPQNDRMEKLVDRMQLLATSVLNSQDVRVHFEADDSLRSLALTMDARKNIFLLFKEAINNIAKYAAATSIHISLRQSAGSALEMSITDNGKGFHPAAEFSGNGLRNMQERAAALGGFCTVKSVIAQGTSIVLRCTPQN